MEFTPAFFPAGITCLDFCNTFDHLQTPPAFDYMTDEATVLKWGHAAGILPAEPGPSGHTDEDLLARTITARLVLYQLMAPFPRGGQPAPADLEAFNALLQEVSAWMKVTPSREGFSLSCGAVNQLQNVLCEVVRSAADLLLANHSERMKQCEECGWFFLDTTRNQPRRWCTMMICGNKAKARRHYERVKLKREMLKE